MRHFLRHEPKRLAGAETDSRKVNPQGDLAVGRTGHQPSRGIGGETASPACGTARRVDLPCWGKSSNITEDVRKYAAEQGLAEEDALKAGMEQKSREFTEMGAEVYTKA